MDEELRRLTTGRSSAKRQLTLVLNTASPVPKKLGKNLGSPR